MTSEIIEKTRKNIYMIGNSVGIIIPNGWWQELEVEEHTTLVLALMESPKHGKYIAIWNPEQQEKKKEEENL